jgi:hypothetical protein
MGDLYPDAPGFRPDSAETSRQAAAIVAPGAGKMLDRIEAYIRATGPASPEEITDAIALPGERLLLTSVRARVCQLRALGRVVDSGERGLGESRRAKVIRWRVATPQELSLHLAREAADAEHGERSHG